MFYDIGQPIGRRDLLRRGAAVSVGGTVVSSLLAACGSGGAGTGASSGTPSPLTLWAAQAPASGYPAIFADAGRRVVADGKASSYTYSYIESANWITKLKTACAGGVPPDVSEMEWSGNYPAFVKAGMLEPLDAILPELPKFYPSATDTLTVDGKTYAIPMDLNNLTIGYNKAIFAKLGLSVPRTFEELLALNEPLRKAGHQPLALAVKEQWPAGDIFFACLAYTDPTGTAVRRAERGEIPWTAPPFVAAAQMAEQLQKSGLLIDGASSLDTLGAVSLFGNQKAAMMYPIGNFLFGLIDEANKGKFEYGIFPVPPPSAGTKARATGGPAILWSVPKRAKNKDAAFEFLRQSTDARSASLMLKKKFIPSYASDTPNGLDPLFKSMLALQPDVATRALLVPEVYTALLNTASALLGGTGSVKDVGTQMQSAV